MSVLDELFGDVSSTSRQQSPQVGLIETTTTTTTAASSPQQQASSKPTHPPPPPHSTRSHLGVGHYFSATLSAPQRSHTQTLSLLSTHYINPVFPSPSTIWAWVSAGRFAEALTALDGIGYVRKAESETQMLLRARNDDDELEQAVGHRDRMRLFRAQALSLHASTTFCADFQNVSLLPFLSDGHCAKARAQVTTKLSQQFAASFERGQSWSLILDEERKQLRREVKFAAEAIEALVLTQAHTVQELVLLSAILQMNRAVYFLCATLLPIKNNSSGSAPGGGGTSSARNRRRHPQQQQQQQQRKSNSGSVSGNRSPTMEDDESAAAATVAAAAAITSDDVGSVSRQSTSSFERGRGSPSNTGEEVPVRPFMPTAAVASAAAALRNKNNEHDAGGGGSESNSGDRRGLVGGDLESEIENALLTASHLIDRPSWRTVAALNRRRIVAHSVATVARRKKQQQQQQHHSSVDENKSSEHNDDKGDACDDDDATKTATLVQEIASAMQRCLRVINKFKAGGKIADTNVLVSCSIMLAELLSALDVALPEALEGTGNNRTGAGVSSRGGSPTQQPKVRCSLCGSVTVDPVTVRVPRFDDDDEEEEDREFDDDQTEGSSSPDPRRQQSGEKDFAITASKLSTARLVEPGTEETAHDEEEEGEYETLIVDRDVWLVVARHLM